MLAACGGGEGPVRDLGTRAVVIGIDGADWKIIDALVAEGELPHLAALRGRAAWGRIATLPDIALSPVIWTSVATGKSATKHGVAWFLVDRPDGTRGPVRSSNRTSKAIWNILAEHGRRPAVVGWWASYPAEDVGDGVVVSDALGFHGFGRTEAGGDDGRKTHPSGLYAELSPMIPDEGTISADFASRFIHLDAEAYAAERFDPARHTRRDPSNPIHLFQQYAVTAQGYTAITEELLDREPWDLLMVYFEQVDSFSHLFMKHAAPRLPWVEEADFDRYRDVVREWYRYQDELLGRLLARIDLTTTAVFVLSDHGFKSGERRIRSERTVDIRKAHLDHETHGIFLAAGPQLRRGVEIEGASVLDVTPTLLHYLGFPVGQDMDGVVLEAIFEPDFRRTNPVRAVASYEEAARQLAQESGSAPSAAVLAEQEAGLRALGYLVDDPEGSDPGAEPPTGGASSPEIHNNLGRIHLGRGEVDAARREFEQALALDADNADALLNLARVERAQGRLAQAEHLVKRALRGNPNSIGALAQLAELRRDQNDLAESVRLYREALSVDDSQPFLFLGLGDSLQRAGQVEAAAAAFRSVLELDPDSFEARYNLGVTHHSQGRLDEAVAEFEQAIALRPEHPSTAYAWNNLADIQLRRGQEEAAVASFARAVALAPAHLESRYNLGSLHLERGRVEEALPLLEEASRIAPDHEWVHASLGMAYLRKGRNDEAYKSLLLVRRLYPGNWIAPLGLALLHANAKQPERARPLLADALRLGGDRARAEAGQYPLLQDMLATL